MVVETHSLNLSPGKENELKLFHGGGGGQDDRPWSSNVLGEGGR
jgi:hypothetical protein